MVNRFRKDKPHIYFRDGYWRVSASGKGGVRKHYIPWNQAHEHIRPWNTARSTMWRLLVAFPHECKCEHNQMGNVSYCKECKRRMSL